MIFDFPTSPSPHTPNRPGVHRTTNMDTIEKQTKKNKKDSAIKLAQKAECKIDMINDTRLSARLTMASRKLSSNDNINKNPSSAREY